MTNTNSKKKYVCVVNGVRHKVSLSFASIDELLDCAMLQHEWLDSVTTEIGDYIVSTNHRLKYSPGFQAFCLADYE